MKKYRKLKRKWLPLKTGKYLKKVKKNNIEDDDIIVK